MFKETEKPLIIAGPCAAESEKQVLESAIVVKERGISAMRSSLWKPRTQPGFEGVGNSGISWLLNASNMGLVVATEVMLPENVASLAKGLENSTQFIVWIGARNQNHIIQREIARRLKEDSPSNSLLMIKNQPWEDKKHWLGIIEHVLSSGISKNRILLCHRGFSSGKDKGNSFRNIPNFDMAMKMKEETGLPMLFDPSHVGGTTEMVFTATKLALKHNFDGFLLEVHPNPTQALTDKNQQLNPKELGRWLNLVKNVDIAHHDTSV